MDLWQAIVLGIVQGIGEFLPISSSGHLILVQHLMGIGGTRDERIAFDVALHGGTLVALIAYFRADLAQLVRAWIASIRERSLGTHEQRLPWFILLGTAPAIAAYLAFPDAIESLEQEPLVVSSMLLGFSFVFLIAERFRGERTIEHVRWWHALAIGCGQALALVPGTSRSGATISTGMMLGFDRAAAARFSFLLSAPVVLAAFVKTMPDLAAASMADTNFLVVTLVGFVVAALSGYLAVAGLLRFLGGHSLAWFTAYRIPVGMLALFIFWPR